MGTSPKKPSARDAKRAHILEAARAVFEAEGLEGASLRAIANKAGYTPAALYFHFDSKEALYGALLEQALERLRVYVADTVDEGATASQRFRMAALGFFDFYEENPKDLDLGFYLFRGGMGPKGLGRERDAALNAALLGALSPMIRAAHDMGLAEEEATMLVAATFAHASGLLLLDHTKRIKLFPVSARALMEEFVEGRLP